MLTNDSDTIQKPSPVNLSHVHEDYAITATIDFEFLSIDQILLAGDARSIGKSSFAVKYKGN